ncbi:TolC family protein [Desulfuromonas carbonis]|uniref:TolC family protein n=1 Tax=Desulfuromonas sp. DDH964 TaxID=1823759 RepID=UPI00078BDC56|nr:TolC family protein [Desulfuromonas sp. DDH964]AMV72248.1 RND family metal ion efflux pump outer membrane protein [Desulfuromonas sp. DDH964]
MKFWTPVLFFLVASLCLAPAVLAVEQSPAPPVLQELVAEALANNPDLQAARDRWELFGHKVAAARTLDDPMLGVAFSNYPIDSFQADQTAMTGNEIKLSQNFPFPGKLAAKGNQAEEQARWYQSVYEDSKLLLAQKVKDAYYRLYFQDRAIAVNEENLDILENFVSLTKTRYEVGTGLQQDLLKAQVAQSQLIDRQLTLRQQRSSVLAEINRLLARPAAQPLGTVSELAMTPVEVDPAALLERAREHRPMFASFESLIERFASQRKLAKLDYLPNFNLWASYRFRDDGLPDRGTDFVSAGFGINLPLWQEKRSEAVAEADSGLRMARRQLEDFSNQLGASIQDIYAQLEKNRDLVQLFATGIIPQAQQSFDASLAAYQVGKVEFLSLLDSLMSLYRYQLDYQRAVSDYQRNVAKLEAATGVTLSGTAALQNPSTDRMKP